MRLRLGFVAYKEKPADYLFKDMRNPRHEIVYVDRGALHVVSGGRDFVMEQGELHVFFPGELHSMWAEPRRAPSFFNIEFSGVIPAITRLRYRRFFTTGPERHLLEGLLREREAPRPYGEELSRCLMSCLLISLLRRAREESAPSKPPPAPARNLGELLVSETKRLIENRLPGPLSLELVARALRVSTSHLSHTFTRIEGVGVWAYVLKRRVDEAKDLLRNSALSMRDIAGKVGFSSQQHFSRAFKERTGMPPREYARSMRS